MDSRVDFALDRTRLLAPNLPPGSLGPMTSYGNDLTRAGVAELARTATPATMTSLAQYQSRFLPSTMSMHSPGASFALMGGFLGGATPADNLKTLMPDMQQFWTPHSADGYPRFVINNAAPYTPFAPFLPTAADTLPSLLPPGPTATSAPGPAHCHRIYELQKDAFLASVAASQAAGLYGIVPNGHPYLEQAAPSTASPHQQPQQLPALPLGPVKQEPRETTSSCHERSSSKASERRHLTSTPRHLPDAGRVREQGGSSGGLHTTNNHNSNGSNSCSLSNGGGSSSSSSSGRSHSAHRSSVSKAQGKAADKKEALKAASHDNAVSVPCKDRAAESSGKQAERRAAADPMVDKPKAPAGSALVLKTDAAKHPEHTLKSSKAQATKSTGNAPQQKGTGGGKEQAQQKVSCAGKESQEVSSGKEQPKLSCSKEASSKAAAAAPRPRSSAAPNGGAIETGAVKSSKHPSTLAAGKSGVRGGEKAGDTSSAPTSAPSPGHPRVGAPEEAFPGQGEHVKDGGGSASVMEKRGHQHGTGSDVRTAGVVRTKAAVSPASSSTTVTPKSTASTGAAVVKTPGGQVVPTLATVTSTSCDVSTVTSVPLTSSGTQSVFARSQPVTSAGVYVTAASPAQLKNSSSSVTSQVATSALPYYHTLYSKGEEGQGGSTGVKRVHATTTFVPEVGTFKGPLIRNMSKGCGDGKAVKSEQPRSHCRVEEGQGSNPDGRSSAAGGDGAGDRSEASSGEGGEDEASDFSLSSPHSQHDGRGRAAGHDDLFSGHERGRAPRRAPTVCAPRPAGAQCLSRGVVRPARGSRPRSTARTWPWTSAWPSDPATSTSVRRSGRGKRRTWGKG